MSSVDEYTVPQETYGPADTYTPSELDDVLFLPDQDVHDPIEESDADIADMTSAPDPNDQFDDSPGEVRTAFGHLEFLDTLHEETSALLNHHKAPVPPVKHDKLDAIRTREAGSDTFRTRTTNLVLGTVTQIVASAQDRRSITLVNYGPGVVAISNRTTQPAVGGGVAPNQFPIPVSIPTVPGQYYPHTLTTKDEIWVTALTATAQLSTLEEYDLEE